MTTAAASLRLGGIFGLIAGVVLGTVLAGVLCGLLALLINIRDLLAQSHILAHTLIDQPFGLRRTRQIGCVVFEPTEQRVWQRAA